MRIVLRTAFIVIGCWLACSAVAPCSVRAEQPAAPAAVESDQKAADMPGCPGKANGGACCASASCQANRAADPSKAVEPAAAGGCPCQRAKQAAQAAQAAESK